MFLDFVSNMSSSSEVEVLRQSTKSEPPLLYMHMGASRGTESMPPPGTIESSPQVLDDDSLDHTDELVYLKNTFIDYDVCGDPDFFAPLRRRCSSEPGPGRAPSVDSSSISLYGATLRSRAARLLETAGLTTASHDILLEAPHASQIARNTGSRSDRLRSTSRMASSSWEVPNMDPNVSENQPNQDSPVFSQPVTRLMVCNLPCKLSDEGLAQMVNDLGFDGLWSDLYIPRGSKNGMGYAFVKFFTPRDAALFAVAVQTYTFPRSTKRPYCKPAALQN